MISCVVSGYDITHRGQFSAAMQAFAVPCEQYLDANCNCSAFTKRHVTYGCFQRNLEPAPGSGRYRYSTIVCRCGGLRIAARSNALDLT